MSIDGLLPPPTGPLVAYALLTGTRVDSVVLLYEAPADDHVQLSAWSGALPTAPGAGYELRVSGAELVWVDTRTVALARSQRVAVMQTARDASIFGTFTWDGSTFEADQVAQTRITGAAFAASRSSGFTTGWRLADNSWRTLNATDTLAVFDALQAHLTAKFTQFATREAAIAAAGTQAAVDAVEWGT